MKKIDRERLLLFVGVSCLGIGFAILSSQTEITGKAVISKNIWDIHYDNVAVSTGSVVASSFHLDSEKLNINFSIDLPNPGDFYEFTVDVVNDGTLDAEIASIVKTEFTQEVAEYLDFQVTYADGSAISEGNLLANNTSATYKVRIKYKDDASNDHNGKVSLAFGVNYVQVTPTSPNYSN